MDPSEALKAAKARVKAAKRELNAAIKVATEMAEFGGKGDAVADDILARAGRRSEAAHTELDNAESELANAILRAGQAARKARDASTPIDDLLLGAATPIATPPPAGSTPPQPDPPRVEIAPPPRPGWSTPVDGLIVPGILPETSHESPQPNEFEPRPLPPDPEEPASATADPTPAPTPATVDIPAGTPRRSIAAIVGLGIIGAGALGAILLLNNGASGPGSTPGPAESGALEPTAAPGSASVDATVAPASVGPGSAAPGSGTFAGRWTMVDGLNDPNGYDVGYTYDPNPPPGEVTLKSGSSAYFDIDVAGRIVAGEYHTSLTTTRLCAGAGAGTPIDYAFDGASAHGETDVNGNGNGVVVWDGTTSMGACPGGTARESSGSVHFQFHIAGEEMIICRSNVTASMTECADPYPRRVALLQRTTP